jgi:hypothetical protein
MVVFLCTAILTKAAGIAPRARGMNPRYPITNLRCPISDEPVRFGYAALRALHLRLIFFRSFGASDFLRISDLGFRL